MDGDQRLVAGDAPEPEPAVPRRGRRGLVLWTLSAVGMAASLAGSYALYRALQRPVPLPSPAQAPPVLRRASSGPWAKWRGVAAPPLSLTTVDGRTIDLASLKGKRVVVDFWATWCRPCVESIPELNRLAKEWGDQLVIVGITGEDRETVASFMTRHSMDYQVVTGVESETLPDPFRQVHAFPTLFFIEKDGTIGSVLEGYHQYDCLESRFWIGEAADRWARGERDQALELAAQTLEVHLEDSTEDDLESIFGADAEYAALHARVTSRIDGLLDHYQRKHGEHFDRDRAAVLWVIWNLGAQHKDAEAVPHLVRYLRESSLEEARWRAADALWEIRDRRAVPDLVAALHDPSLKVAGFAASALGDLEDASAVGPLLELFERLPDNREEAKARIADALGKLGDPRATAPIAASLERIKDPDYVRWGAPALRRLEAAGPEGRGNRE